MADGAEATARPVVDRLSGVEATGEAADGLVKITLTGAGVMSGVEISPKAKRLACEDLEAAIKEAFDAANQGLRSQLDDLDDLDETAPGEPRDEGLQGVLDDAARRLDGLTQLAAELNQAVKGL